MTFSISAKLRSMQALPVIAPADPVPPAEATAAREEAPALPVPRQQRPTRPASLTGPARKVWDAVVSELEHLGVIGVLDRGALHRYCVLRVEWEELTATLRASPGAYYTTTDSGTPHVSGAFSVRRQVSAELSILESELGMNPSARARLLLATYGARPLAAPRPPAAPKAPKTTPRGPRGAYRKRGVP